MDDVKEILIAINNNLARLVIVQQSNAYLNYLTFRALNRDKEEYIDPIGKEYERWGIDKCYQEPDFI